MTPDDTQVLAVIPTADAVLMRPPVQLETDHMLGRLTESQYRQALIHAAELALAVLQPDSPRLPS